MTFLLSEINHDGVIMASDSSESIPKPSGEVDFAEIDKTLYFKELNIGISMWGKSWLGSHNVNEWLKDKIQEFVFTKSTGPNQALAEITNFLADKLNKECKIDGTNDMGFHIAGYNSDNEGASPGICHVFIQPGFPKFHNQHIQLELPKDIPACHLRNGMYKEFSVMWPALSGLDESFRSQVSSKYKSLIKPHPDPVAVRAEWLGSWVKQMCLVFKTAGLPEYIGKTVKVLTFNQKGNVRKFQLGKMKEVP
jgi:hypothetical protein